LGGILSHHTDFSLLGKQQSSDNLQETALSRPVFSQKPMNSRFKIQGEPIKERSLAVPKIQIFDFNHGNLLYNTGVLSNYYTDKVQQQYNKINPKKKKSSEKRKFLTKSTRYYRKWHYHFIIGRIKKELFPTGTAKEKEVYEKRNGGRLKPAPNPEKNIMNFSINEKLSSEIFWRK
jgi:hypothetical protein